MKKAAELLQLQEIVDILTSSTRASGSTLAEYNAPVAAAASTQPLSCLDFPSTFSYPTPVLEKIETISGKLWNQSKRTGSQLKKTGRSKKKALIETEMEALKTTVQCPHCPYAFHHKAELRLHLKSHAWTQRPLTEYNNSVARAKASLQFAEATCKSKGGLSSLNITCRTCGLDFNNAARYKAHIRRRHLKQYHCEVCRQAFTSHKLKQLHFARQPNCRPERSVKRCICKYCKRVFLFKKTRMQHQILCQKGLFKCLSIVLLSSKYRHYISC